MSMNNKVRVIALIVLCALAAIAPQVYGHLPVTRDNAFVTPYPEWTGVITVAVAPTFLPAKGGFVPYVLKCARDVERKYPGVLVRVEDIPIKQLLRRLETGENLPDIVVTGAGAVNAPEGLLKPLSAFANTAGEAYVAACSLDGVQYGAPIAAGAYGLMVNVDWMDKAQVSPATPFDEMIPALKASALKKGGLALQCPLTAYGLPAAALAQITGALPVGLEGLPKDLGVADPASAWPDFVLEQRYAMYMCTQREVERLRVLRAGNKGINGNIIALTSSAWTDQVLYGGILLRDNADAGLERAALHVLEALSAPYAQERLKGVGAFSVVDGIELYDEVSANMRTLEISLHGARVANVFSPGVREEAANAVRKLADPAAVPQEVYRIVFYEQ